MGASRGGSVGWTSPPLLNSAVDSCSSPVALRFPVVFPVDRFRSFLLPLSLSFIPFGFPLCSFPDTGFGASPLRIAAFGCVLLVPPKLPDSFQRRFPFAVVSRSLIVMIDLPSTRCRVIGTAQVCGSGPESPQQVAPSRHSPGAVT